MFIHLHNHTHYSLLDGLTKIDDLIEKAKADGAPAVAISDHGVMYGAIEFYEKCKKADIKPIIGMESYLAPNSRFDKNTKDDARNFHLLLIAKNNTGYKNLIKLTSLAHLEGFYYKPRIDWELLEKHHEGLIGLTACLGGEIPRLIMTDKMGRAKERVLEYNKLFGQGNFYLEIMDHPELEGQDKVNKGMVQLSKETGVPLVATNDLHYLNKEDDEAQDILLCLQNKKKLEDTDRMKMKDLGNYSYRPAKEMEEAFKDLPEAIENTVKIAEACNLEIELGNTQLPHFEVPEGYDGNSYLKKICEDGLLKRYGEKLDRLPKKGEVSLEKVRERMEYELSVIEKMGWPSYFLIVSDFVNWAKNNKIVVGPGRGSAAGSLVCYLTGITELDPLEYDLLFERFLNPDRISMPDIDMDFADTRRGEVIAYVEDKYGKDHVAQIITFSTMAARAAIRDVGRVLNEPYDYCDRLAKMVPMNYKLGKAIEEIGELREIYEKEAQAKRILDFAKILEGVARHSSMHACGVLITKNPLTDYVPLQYASSSDKDIVSQYSLHPIEDLGLLKMDFLGLKNLTIIEAALRIIKNTRGLEIKIEELSLEDGETFRLLQRGETTGVFQLESSGMKRYLKELIPTTFEDIIAMVALYRPGPMDWIPEYINRKHGRIEITYLHPKLESILEKTYGVAIYQEQVMQISRELAGFSRGEADTLRKAMGKKIPALLAEQKEKFINGCVNNGLSKELAIRLFSFIEPFAGYGFNRSHAACYAMIAYQTAYLKAHFPAEFMAALLTADQHDIDRIAIEIEECRKMGMNIMPPDVNESFASFTVVTSGTKDNKVVAAEEKVSTIRFGLSAVKNVGEHITEVLIAERKANGPYSDIFNLLERITDKDMNKKSLESLIKCGAMDGSGERGELLANIETLLEFNKETVRLKDSRQNSLFFDTPSLYVASRPKLTKAATTGKQDKLIWEKELLGLYISEHPFNDYKPYLRDFAVPIIDLAGKKNDNYVNTAGVITSIKKIITRSSQAMLFVKIEDGVNNVELLIFPSLLEETKDEWREGRVVLVSGKVSDKDQESKVLANKVLFLDSKEEADIKAKVEEMKKIVLTLIENGGNGRRYYPKKNNDGLVSPKEMIPSEATKTAKKKNLNQVLLRLKGVFSPAEVEKLREMLLRYPGEKLVYLEINKGDSANLVKTAFKVSGGSELSRELEEAFSGRLKVVEN